MLTMLREGGFTMFPLALCSLAAATIIIERFFALRRSRIFDPRMIKLVDEYSASTSAEKAVLLCKRVGGPFARVIEEVILCRHLGHVEALEMMHAAGRTQVGVLERGLIVLEIVAGASPLLGLLGTVLGMRSVFNAITAEGLGNPGILSGGISEALITTVAGLTIAIPAMACHSWFCSRVDDFATEMQDRATGFVAKLQSLQADR